MRHYYIKCWTFPLKINQVWIKDASGLDAPLCSVAQHFDYINSCLLSRFEAAPHWDERRCNAILLYCCQVMSERCGGVCFTAPCQKTWVLCVKTHTHGWLCRYSRSSCLLCLDLDKFMEDGSSKHRSGDGGETWEFIPGWFMRCMSHMSATRMWQTPATCFKWLSVKLNWIVFVRWLHFLLQRVVEGPFNDLSYFYKCPGPNWVTPWVHGPFFRLQSVPWSRFHQFKKKNQTQ